MRQLICLMILFTATPLLASDKLISNSVSDSEANVVTGTGDSLAIGFGHALGDVDIAQCLASTQWDTILMGKQKLVLNNVCMAEFYLANGKWALAAMALCNQKEILGEFDSEGECERAHDFGPPPPPPPIVETIVPVPGPPEECCTDMNYLQQEEILVAQDQIETLEQRLARIERNDQKRRDYAQQTIERLENDPEE